MAPSAVPRVLRPVQPPKMQLAGLCALLVVAAGCQREASARSVSGSEVAEVFDSLESSNRATERLLDSARLQLDSALQAMVEIASLTDRVAGEPVRVVTQRELPGSDRIDIAALRARSVRQLDRIQQRLQGVDASLRSVRDTSQTLRDQVTRLTKSVAALTRASQAQETRLAQLARTLREVEVERDRAVATSQFQQNRADTLREVLAYTIEKTRARDDSVFLLIGDANQLKTLGVAERKGGIAGIGSVLTLRGVFPRDAFTVLSKEAVSELPMPTAQRDYRLVSAQRPACYSWTRNADSVAVLRVLDADCFWESSRYLVIEERK